MTSVFEHTLDAAEVKKITHVVLVLDETGSMEGLRDETIISFNKYLAELRRDLGDTVLFTLRLFNTGGIRALYTATPITYVTDLNRGIYNPMSGTPLYDAMAKTMIAVDSDMARAEGRLFVTLSDGQENASLQFKRADVARMIAERKERAWTFVFLGTNFDAYHEGHAMGVSAANTMTFDRQSTAPVFHATATATSNYRTGVMRGVAGQSSGHTTADFYSDADKAVGESKTKKGA